ncbi:MAG: energy transducer TonB [Paludibacteraceae bacterium]|nr:energy transducer TonB [Paludibacteraceae bacterium]
MKTRLVLGAIALFSVLPLSAQNNSHPAKPDSDPAPDEQPTLAPEQMPEYPGGMSALFSFIAENVQYPEEAKKADKGGRVLCAFVITKTGKVTDVHVVRSSDTQCLDDEAVRVISMLPNWKPGTVKGKPVDVAFTIPVNFTLK